MVIEKNGGGMVGEERRKKKKKSQKTVGIQEAKKVDLFYLFILSVLFNFEIAQVCHAARKEAT